MPPKSTSITHIVHWHRTDLRIHDSPSIQRALSYAKDTSDAYTYNSIFTFDPHYVHIWAPGSNGGDSDERPHLRVGPNRWQFLLDCLGGLDESLKARTKGNDGSKGHEQRLWVCRGAPGDILEALCQGLVGKKEQKGKVVIVFETDPDAYAQMRDEEVCKRLEALKLGDKLAIEAVEEGRTLWPSKKLVKANGGKPTMTFAQTVKAGEQLGPVQKPAPTPKGEDFPKTLDFGKLAEDGVFKVEGEYYEQGKKNEKSDDNAIRTYAHGIWGPNKNFDVPTMEELGFGSDAAKTPIRGGEAEGLKVLDRVIKEKNGDYVATFEKPHTAPTDFDPPATTLLSPHLHLGSVGVREFFWRVKDVIDKHKKEKKHVSSEPANLPGQLIFRDMYFGAIQALGKQFTVVEGNPVCRFIPWHLQDAEDIANPPPGDEEAAEWFKRWAAGTTGFPWIDALMRQLTEEGWIHHLGRHALACFLTRGGCYISWERGAEVFEEKLLDHEVACNVGNWMWLSCSAFFAQFYRCYSPIKFPQKWDPNGEFIRKYIPELKEFDKKYIYEPWKAPISDQKKWGCRVVKMGDEVNEKGTTYPKPMFDFDERRQICIDGMKHAYDVGLYGNDSKVLDGSWKEVFGVEGKKGGHEEKAKKANGEAESEASHKEKKDTKHNDATKEENAGDEAEDPEEGQKGKKRANTRSTGLAKRQKKIDE